MTRAQLLALATTAPSIATRRAAREALAALDVLDTCLALDAGAPTHLRPDGSAACDVRHTLGPARSS